MKMTLETSNTADLPPPTIAGRSRTTGRGGETKRERAFLNVGGGGSWVASPPTGWAGSVAAEGPSVADEGRHCLPLISS